LSIYINASFLFEQSGHVQAYCKSLRSRLCTLWFRWFSVYLRMEPRPRKSLFL